mmetsp:Transcript_10537/g.21779  ORF Transcript_10537/g.21779 Transcript_10537/m.21779 type:complete len:337 (-) Transcript_10537:85-1095(-)
MPEPVEGRRVILSGDVNLVSNEQLAAHLEVYGAIERVTAGFLKNVAFVLFEERAGAKRACAATKGSSLFPGFALSVRKANEHVFRQACKIYNVGPTFPFSPVAPSALTEVSQHQTYGTGAKVLATLPQSSGRQEGKADDPGAAVDPAVTYDIADSDEERPADVVWSSNWAQIPASSPTTKAKAARRRRSRKKKLGEQCKSVGDTELHDHSSGATGSRKHGKSLVKTKPATPLIASTASQTLVCDSETATDGGKHFDVARSSAAPAWAQESTDFGSRGAVQRHGSQLDASSFVGGGEGGTQWYGLGTPKLNPSIPSNAMVEPLEDLDGEQSDSSVFW